MGTGRQLFIYWRCALEDRAAALAETRACQQRLRMQVPGLQAHLFVRVDAEQEGRATLMETYAHALGVDGATQQRIEQEAEAARSRWCRGDRHVEVFESADD